MTVYEFRCVECGEVDEVTADYLALYGTPWHHKKPMRRIYQANVVWPKDQRGH